MYTLAGNRTRCIALSPYSLADVDPHGFLGLCNIQPLFELPNLESLTIRAQLDPQCIDNTAVLAMVTAWPNLRHLDLLTSHGPSIVDVDGLAMFAACRQLESLGIVINAWNVADVTYLHRPGNKISCNSLRSLTLGQSPIQHPKTVAAILSDTFPNLTQIEAWAYYDGEHQMPDLLWQECISLHKSFADTRGW